MKATDLQAATVLLAQIHEIDKQLKTLHERATLLIKGGGNVKGIELSFMTEVQNDEVYDSEDFINGMQERMIRTIAGAYRLPAFKLGGAFDKPAGDPNKLKFVLDESETLYVISALIAVKEDQRKRLADQIYKLGVTV